MPTSPLWSPNVVIEICCHAAWIRGLRLQWQNKSRMNSKINVLYTELLEGLLQILS